MTAEPSPLPSARRRELIAAGHPLRPAITIAVGEPDDGVLAHLRQALAAHELLKVRIRTDDRDQCRQTAERLAERVPCHLVQLVGRVVLLSRR